MKSLVEEAVVHEPVRPIKQGVIEDEGNGPVGQDGRPRRQGGVDLHAHPFVGVVEEEEERDAGQGAPDADIGLVWVGGCWWVGGWFVGGLWVGRTYLVDALGY